MVPGFFRRIALAWGFALAACTGTAQPIPDPPEGALRLATYNVHYIWLDRATGPWSVGDWERRKAPLDKAFKALNADIVAFQEMESFSHGSDGSVNLTLDWLRARNPDYGVAAAGDWRQFPSTQPILFRRDKFDVIDQGWFFFSDTPDMIYARTFDGSYPAFASWAALRERDSGKALTVVNVHFDFSSRSNQRRSAELVADRIRPWIGNGERVVVIGDINGSLRSTPVKILQDAGLTFVPVSGATYHWNRGLNLTAAIDHIAYSDSIEATGEPMVVRQKFDGEWPTDHYPVFSDFKLR